MSEVLCPYLMAARAAIGVGGVHASRGDVISDVYFDEPAEAFGIKCVGSWCAKWVPDENSPDEGRCIDNMRAKPFPNQAPR